MRSRIRIRIKEKLPDQFNTDQDPRIYTTDLDPDPDPIYFISGLQYDKKKLFSKHFIAFDLV
jgi:hypothetical protein